MATFQPRVLGSILNDILAYVSSQTDMTTEVGSFVRSLAEAVAIEVDETNYQMVLLLDGYATATATGGELDRRAADYDIERLQPEASIVYCVIRDENLVQSTLAFDEAVGSTSIQLASTATFPAAGFPYTIRIGEGTLQVEDVSVTANNVGTNTLTLAAGLVNDHAAGSRAARVTGAAAINVAAGVQVQVPQRGTEPAIVFVTQEAATIENGDYESQEVLCQAQLSGAGGNVGVGRVTEFSGAAPFTGAGVINKSRGAGGRDLETDQALRDRILERIQSLSTGNLVALRNAALGVSDATTGQRVVTANIIEDFARDEVRVLIDDGTGFNPDRVVLAQSEVAVAIAPASPSVRVTDASQFPSEGYVILSPEDASQMEAMRYTSVNYGTGTLTFSGVTANAHDLGDEVLLVEPVDLNAEAGRNYWTLAQYAILRNSDRIFVDEGSGFTEWTEGIDYEINRGVGQLQKLDAGVAAGSRIFAHYSYYTGLVGLVQKVINGDPLDSATYPGVRSAGVEVLVETPDIRRIRVRASISALAGFDEAALRPLVQEAIELYVSSLGIGNDVILAEIITSAMNVAGVYNVVVTEPTSDVAILENQLPLPISSSGTSLVTVS